MEVNINDNILSLINKTSDSLMTGIAERVKQRRLEKGWIQKTLTTQTRVSFEIKRVMQR